MPFEKITAYDAPGVLLEQVLDGTINRHSIPDILNEVFTDDPTVPPNFRHDLEQRIFGGWGDQNPVAKTVAGLATNPFVWLMMLTHVPAKNVVGGLFDVLPSKGAWVSQRSGILKYVETFMHAARGTSGARFTQEALSGILEADTHFKSRIAPAYMEMIGKNGDVLTTDNPSSRLLNMLLHIRQEGLNKDVTSTVYTQMSKKGLAKWVESGGAVVGGLARKPVVRKALVDVSDDVIEEMLQDRGALNFSNAIREAYNDRRTLLIGREGANTFEVDRDKLLKLYSQFRRGSPSRLSEGSISAGQLFGPDILSSVRKGEMSWEEWQKAATEIVQDQYNNAHYMPRNLFEAVDMDGVTSTSKRAFEINRGILPVAPGTQFRGRHGHVVHVDDLNYLRDTFGMSPGLDDAYAQWTKEINKLKPGQLLTARRLDFATSTQRYMTSTGKTWSLFVRPVSEDTLLLQKDVIDKARTTGLLPKGKLRGRVEDFAKDKVDYGVDLDTAFLDVPEHLRPEGGFTVADGLDQFYRLISDRNPALKSTTDNVIIPHLLGRTNVETTVGHAVLTTLQNWARGLDSVGILKSVEGVSNYTDDVIRRIRNFSSKNIDYHTTLGATKSLASFLYLTHLSQIPSVLMNLTQPLVTTARWLSPGDLLAGYREGARQMSGYVKDRIKIGPRAPIEEVGKLIKKHFRHADLADINPNQMELLDFTLTGESNFKGLTKRSVAGGIKSVLMGGFTSAEVFNRVVTAEGFAVKARRLGVSLEGSGIAAAKARQEVAEAVAESQFGSSLLNTPKAFIDPASPLSNPLLKQFLQFPIRMMTSPFLVGSIAGGETNAFRGVANDVLRGMGLSAIGYELLKGMAGVQYDEAGFFQGTTQLFTGFIDDQDGPLPIPPVVDIAAEAGKLLTGQDNEFLQRTMPRLVPGGLQLSKALGVLPNVHKGILNETFMRTTYADWKHPNEDGTINVYKSDGTLMSQSSPQLLVMRGLGLDLTKFQDQSQFDRFVSNMRDDMTAYRKEFATAILNHGDIPQALEIKKDFLRRFGFELKLDNAQLKSALELRTKPRTQRILDRLPPEVRVQYAELLRQQGEAQGIQERLNEASGLR